MEFYFGICQNFTTVNIDLWVVNWIGLSLLLMRWAYCTCLATEYHGDHEHIQTSYVWPSKIGIQLHFAIRTQLLLLCSAQKRLVLTGSLKGLYLTTAVKATLATFYLALTPLHSAFRPQNSRHELWRAPCKTTEERSKNGHQFDQGKTFSFPYLSNVVKVVETPTHHEEHEEITMWWAFP